MLKNSLTSIFNSKIFPGPPLKGEGAEGKGRGKGQRDVASWPVGGGVDAPYDLKVEMHDKIFRFDI